MSLVFEWSFELEKKKIIVLYRKRDAFKFLAT